MARAYELTNLFFEADGDLWHSNVEFLRDHVCTSSIERTLSPNIFLMSDSRLPNFDRRILRFSKSICSY